MIDQNELNRITEKIIGAAIEVHRALGPGLLESAYQACLLYELKQIGFEVEAEKVLPVVYKEVTLDCGHRIDLLVESLVIVELKSVDEVAPIHQAQILSYLKLSACPVGLLINFNVPQLTQGIKQLPALTRRCLTSETIGTSPTNQLNSQIAHTSKHEPQSPQRPQRGTAKRRGRAHVMEATELSTANQRRTYPAPPFSPPSL